MTDDQGIPEDRSSRISAAGKLLIGAQRRSSFFDRQCGLGKEGLDQVGFLAQATDGEVKLLVQLLQVPTHQVTHLHVLQVMPAPFIPRVTRNRQMHPI